MDFLKIVKEHISYCHESGDMTWIKSKGAAKAGRSCGCTISNGDGNTYKIICVSGVNILAHRLAWLIYYGKEPDGQIDHIDGDGLNNAIKNLREVTNQGNARNQKLRSNNKSGVCGVIWFKPASLWRAQIKVNGKYKYLGYFKDFNDAVDARKKAEIEFGFHKNHGTKR